MGDHTAYFRTADGEEELVFVRLARALATRCNDTKWYDTDHYHKVELPRKGKRSKKHEPSGSHEHLTLSEILNVDVDSLNEVDFSHRLKSLGVTAENTYLFDATVAEGQGVAGYLRLKLNTRASPIIEGWEPNRLSMNFRLLSGMHDDEEGETGDLNLRALAIAFICGAGSDGCLISQIKECAVVPEGVQPTLQSIFSTYRCSTRDTIVQLHEFRTHRATAEINACHSEESLQILKQMDDQELFKWYLEIANSLPRYHARKAGKGLLTSTTEPMGMVRLYSALLDSLQ